MNFYGKNPLYRNAKQDKRRKKDIIIIKRKETTNYARPKPVSARVLGWPTVAPTEGRVMVMMP